MYTLNFVIATSKVVYGFLTSKIAKAKNSNSYTHGCIESGSFGGSNPPKTFKKLKSIFNVKYFVKIHRVRLRIFTLEVLWRCTTCTKRF